MTASCKQAEPFENGLTIAADEFAADTVPGITSGFPNRDGNFALPQTDAQCESRQPAADDRDGFAGRHCSLLSPRYKQVAEQADGLFYEQPVFFIRPER